MGQSGKGGGELPKELSFVEVEPKEIALSMLKQAEKRETIVVRLFNPTDSEISGKVNFHQNIKEAWLINLNEERKEELPLKGSSISINFGVKKIVTIEIIPK